MAIKQGSRRTLRYRGHEIVAAELQDKPTATVSQAGVPTTRERFIGNTIEEAIEAAKRWVDTKQRNRRQPNIGTVQEYVDAFSTLERKLKNKKELKNYELMLRAHATDGILTTRELAKAAGWPDYGTANMHYGILGEKVADLIGLELKLREDGSEIGITALATGLDEADESSGHFRWEIHDEVKEALHRLGLLQVGATAR